MTTPLRQKIVHISIGTIATIIIVVLGLLGGALRFGKVGGGFEAKVQAHEDKWEEYEPDIKKIPVIESEISNAHDDRQEIKGSLNRIEDLLLNKIK